MVKAPPFDLNIILPVVSRGLLNDAIILKQAVQEHDANIHVRIISKEKGYLGIAIKSLAMSIRYLLRIKQVSFHLEEIQPFYTNFSKHNFFIPNQEWLRDRTRSQMKNKNIEVLCKTNYAVERLANISSSIRFLGFTSINRNNSTPPDYNKFIHIAGRSPQKGTLPLLKLWSKKTAWPELIVITTTKTHVEYDKFSNIKIVDSFITENELNKLINECGVHICPSEAEGFGHSIVEALAVGACVLTTNGAPMNELVADQQCLISPEQTSTRYLSELFFVSERTLEQTINKIIHLSIAERKVSGELSKQKYAELNEHFNTNIGELVLYIKSKV
jgi:glycosyltransferase involved in cell wall biosynthesis